MNLKEAARIVFDYLNYAEEPARADAIMVFGGSRIDPVLRAYDLYTKGFAPKISFISIGGNYGGDKIWGMTEAKKYRSVLEEKGMPREDILSAELSTNTLEESEEIVPFLKNNGINPKKIIVISRPLHQRRAWATFNKQNPEIESVSCPGNETTSPTSAEVLERLPQEIDRLILYAKQGDLTAQVIPREVMESVKVIRDS